MKRLSIVIPAYCEEERLALATEEVISAASETLDEFEVIIVNDGSTDATGEVADRLAATYPMVSVIHFNHNQGVGAAYRAGLKRARFENLSLVPGDRPFERSGLVRVFGAVGLADMVISYRVNPRARTPVRRLMSRVFTTQLGITTRCRLRDGHSMYVWPVELARRIQTPPGYAYHLVTMVKLLQQVSTYAEVPVILTPKPDASSRVLRWGVVSALAWRLSLLTLESLRYIGEPRPRAVPVPEPRFALPLPGSEGLAIEPAARNSE
jgi:hypothetical protein